LSRHQSAPWLLAFSTITVLTLLVGGNAVIEWAERRGAVNTQIPGEVVQTVDEPIFEEDGPWYRTSTYGQGSVVSSRFSRDKEQRWRMFVLGGSFAMGTPYVNGEEPQSGSEGGIASWLQGNLSARFPESIEIVNAAAGGQDSRRVLEIGRETLELQPDLLLIAMGNNEGNLGEDRVRANLRKLGGYRLLRKVLLRSQEPRASWFTPQDVDNKQLRRAFTERLEAFLIEAERRAVPVLLATMPINLSYLGFEPGKLIQGHDWPPLGGECEAGIRAFEAQRFQASIAPLTACLKGPDSQQPPPLRSYLALAHLESGKPLEEDLESALVASHGPCVSAGISHYYAGNYTQAISDLEQCDEVAEAVLWIGRARRAAGEVTGARRALLSACELVPRNRTRPSLNEAIRTAASRHKGAHLVDLEAAAEDFSRSRSDGIPGPEQFLDYCHMNWIGYATMADAVLQVIEQQGLGPSGDEAAGPPSREELRTLFRLPMLEQASEL
jgi:lysophospholipase L1-like esterase